MEANGFRYVVREMELDSVRKLGAGNGFGRCTWVRRGERIWAVYISWVRKIDLWNVSGRVKKKQRLG